MFPPGSVTQHPNGVRFSAFDEQGEMLREQVYFSIGGGFIVADRRSRSNDSDLSAGDSLPLHQRG